MRLSVSSPCCSRGLHLHPGKPSKTLISQFTPEVELALFLLIAVLLYSTTLFWFLFFFVCLFRVDAAVLYAIKVCGSPCCCGACLKRISCLCVCDCGCGCYSYCYYCFFDISFALICFWQVEAEDHCTSQTRLLIDQISMQQERVLALEGGLGWFTLFL